MADARASKPWDEYTSDERVSKLLVRPRSDDRASD